MHQKGFTFLELIVVIAMISIVSVLAAPGLTAFTNRLHLETTVRNMASDLREMKMKAIIERNDLTINFHPETNSYDLPVRSVNLPPRIRFGFDTGVLGPPGNPADTPEEDGVTFPSNRVSFYSQGTNSMGTIYLTDDEANTLAITLTITGRVRIWKWKEGTWI